MKTATSILAGLMLLVSAGSADAATRVFQSAGNWSAPANWQGSLKPGTGDDVVIAANCTVDENIAVFTFATITVNAGVNLMLMQYALVFSGAVTNNGFIYTANTSNAPLPAGKNWGSYVFFDAAGAQTVPQGTYYALKTSASGTSRTVSAGGDITVTHELYVEGFTNTNEATFDLGTWKLLGTPSYTYVTGRLRTANTSTTPLPAGRRWYSNMPMRQGVVEFYSSSPQYIPGGTYDDDLILSSSTKTLTGVMYSNGILTLSQAVLAIVDSDAVIGVTGTIGAGAGIFSPANMIATTGTGELVKKFSSGGTFAYPVGELAGSADYTPAVLTFPAVTGTFSAGVRVVDAKHPQNSSSASFITRYWSVDVVSTAMRSGSAEFTYVHADVTGPEQDMFTGQWIGAAWQKRNRTDTTLNRLSATGVQLAGDFTGYDVAVPAACVIDARALLQGPAIGTSGTMNTALNAGSHLPLQQPYGTAPWNYAGSESLSLPLPPSMVDWVLLELRATPTGSAVARRAALLLSNGLITDLNASSAVSFPGVQAGNYYLVLRHRNHLAVMSAAPLAVSSSTPAYDFRTAASQAWGTEAMTGLSGGQAPFALWAGDANADGRLKYIGNANDPLAVMTRIGGSDITAAANGYNREDITMDGTVRYSGAGNDRAVVLRNIGGVNVGVERLSMVP